jgi:hypothetical protein
MDASSYVPVSCGLCAGHYLQPVTSGVVPSCRSCGAPAAVLPGATYTEADVATFDRIEAAVRLDLKSARAGYRLLAELRHATSAAEDPESIMLRVVDELPSLSFLLPALCLKPATRQARTALVRSTGMIMTLLEARSQKLELLVASSSSPTPALGRETRSGLASS